ncbi:MAG TPA: 3-oxo-5-alpha-steroid 4-dehydrogenase [Thermoanaerobaculia bacterium]|nr:3-oxo-5-alpha-steroid 4-dehydrogenase [Thermoanaerobaculia bacterium]
MSEATIYPVLLGAWTALAAVAFVALLLRPAPYGRYASRGGRLAIPSRWGWMLMESPAVVLFVALWATGRHRDEPASIAFLLLWLAHYAYRDLIYPFRLGARGARPMPLEIVATAFGFQLVNVYLNARWLFELAPVYPRSWLVDPRFLAGVALFAAGTWVNRRADATLRALAARGDGEYGIPRGGLFERVSCPNYLGEIAIWSGWALATWSLPGLAFALWTVANLAPRARAHHRFYRERFPDYPPERRALVPFVW